MHVMKPQNMIVNRDKAWGPYHAPNKQSAWNNPTRNKNGGTKKSTKDLNFSNIIGL